MICLRMVSRKALSSGKTEEKYDNISITDHWSAKDSKSLPICCLFAVSYGVPFGPLATLHFSLWAKMQRCNGETCKVLKAKERRSDGDAQRFKGEGTIFILLFRVRTLAFTPQHFRLRLFFSLFHKISCRYRFRPSCFAWSCFLLVHMRHTVWRPLCLL